MRLLSIIATAMLSGCITSQNIVVPRAVENERECFLSWRTIGFGVLKFKDAAVVEYFETGNEIAREQTDTTVWPPTRKTTKTKKTPAQ